MFSNFQKFLDGPVDLDSFYGIEKSSNNLSRQPDHDSEIVDRAYMLPSDSHSDIRRNFSNERRSHESNQDKPPTQTLNSSSNKLPQNIRNNSQLSSTLLNPSKEESPLDEISECEPHQEQSITKMMREQRP